jgi:hypothetical protein
MYGALRAPPSSSCEGPPGAGLVVRRFAQPSRLGCVPFATTEPAIWAEGRWEGKNNWYSKGLIFSSIHFHILFSFFLHSNLRFDMCSFEKAHV